MKAKIALRAESLEEAEAIAGALNPDNSLVPQGMKISTRTKGSEVVTEIKFSGRIDTLMSTIDDLLKCAQAAERALKCVSKTQTRSDSVSYRA